ncbi:TetR/AcrR family transcriptional regulator [Actinomycetospora straminea]|uniref:ABC-F family ATP-binding cassette domain-containing protein n=1 Tax=Actinomycetospora straminea TaxID=663607 RepID=A0ABP9EKM7_9PSEU|nr:TetR/AcrR family transcriptional regulator [Actinomycetospora straminea]MDD7936391.1 TetR/AcrR family transcriptional regulator [Actinomycetospora straminea]
MDRRDVLADAAIAVLARDGGRGLTHRAVDATAELAEGTSSYYFRTRAALLQACVDRLTARTLAEVPSATRPPADVDELVEAAVALVGRWLTADRDRLLARWELALESTRRPELGAALRTGGARIRQRVAATLDGLGVPDPARRADDLVACLDGLAFDDLAGAGPQRDAAGLRAAVTDAVHGFTSGRA